MADVLSGKLPEDMMKGRVMVNISRKRKHAGVGSYIPERSSPGPKKCTLDELVSTCIEQEISCNSWMSLLMNEFGNVLKAVKKLTPPQRDLFLGKYEEAKCVWSCTLCDRMDSSMPYIYCELCCSTYHRSCAGLMAWSNDWTCPDCSED